MSRDHLLGLDLGTTRICALLIDAGGTLRARVNRPLATRFPAPGRVEQDPRAMWEGAVAALRAALAEAGLPASRVAALGVATQRATALAWRPDGGEALAPALGWQDQRAAERAAELRAAGIPVSALTTALKLEWWLRHEAAVAEAAAAGTLCFGTPDVWLSHRLTAGQAFVTDPGEASCTGLYELAKGDWHEAALAHFGIARDLLPEVVASAAVVGETPAELLGAPVPVAARAGDQQAAAFAQGIHRPGQAKLTLGTAAMLDLHVASSQTKLPPGTFPLVLWRLGDRADAFCQEGTVVTAGAAVEWLVQLGLLSRAAELDAVARSVPDSQGAVFLPALQGLGTPFLDDRVRGQLGGLTRGSGRAHVVRAVLEGVAQRCADLCDALAVAPGPLAVDGGLSRSELLLQTLADLSGCTLERAAEPETTALGAAWLAGLGCGLLPDSAACRALAAPPVRIEPRLPEGERSARRERWRRLLERAVPGS